MNASIESKTSGIQSLRSVVNIRSNGNTLINHSMAMNASELRNRIENMSVQPADVLNPSAAGNEMDSIITIGKNSRSRRSKYTNGIRATLCPIKMTQAKTPCTGQFRADCSTSSTEFACRTALLCTGIDSTMPTTPSASQSFTRSGSRWQTLDPFTSRSRFVRFHSVFAG